MKMNKYNKGITLVALVVTIVVLIILAGISINLVLDDNGIISKAQESRRKTAEGSTNDEKWINELAESIDSMLSENKNPKKDVPVEPTTETAPYFPDSTFEKVGETTLDNGLVIQDSNGNQFVWVEVPKSLYNDDSYNSNKTKKPSSSVDYDNIEYCLHQYTMTFRKGSGTAETSYNDTWVEDASNGDWMSSAEYTEKKHKMLKSIYENGGFYVGRYETGIDTEKEESRYFDISDGTAYTTLHTTTQTPVIKENEYPYIWVRRTQAQKLAESFNYNDGTKEYTGSLMFGVQWDLVLAFMRNHDVGATDSTIITDSTTIGNYYNSVFKLNENGKYTIFSNKVLSSTWIPATTVTENYVNKGLNKGGFSSYGNGILITTGTSAKNCIANIYDIAGNVEEWTLENTVATDKPCAGRGGNYGTSGKFASATYRGKRATNESSYDVGFRIALF